MSLKPIYELDTITTVDENHTVLVYQDQRLKKLNAKDLFYSKDEIRNMVTIPKNNIIKSLADLNVSVLENATLYDLINYVDKIDLFEIGIRRLIHDGSDTSAEPTTPSATNNPKYTYMGKPQTSSRVDRCYKIGGMLTVIPAATPNADTDILYAAMSSNSAMNRNDFYGGDYASEKWKDGIYPWNEMQQVTDEYSNVFTRVPLYFIKEEFVTDDGVDISASWPMIPEKYLNSIIYKYTFVCKTKLPGYRPADFFYDYKEVIMNESATGDYVYIQDLDCYTIPLYYDESDVRYELSTTATDSGTYTKILTRYHDFSCYEASHEVIDGKTCIASKSGVLPTVSTQLATFRTYCKNLDERYQVRDIRGYNDFFCTLFDIEFATINCQSVANGVAGGVPYDAKYQAQEDASSSNTVIVNYNFKVNTYLCIGTSAGSQTVCKDRKVLSSVANGDGNYTVTFDGDPVNITAGNVVWGTRYPCGWCDDIPYRSAYAASAASTAAPFKWNWIENPYANIWKFIDGFHIKHEADANGLLENCIYVTNNPLLYSNSFTGYEKLRYIMPSEFLNSSDARTSGGNSYVMQLGYDAAYPWCQVTSKVGGSSSTYYADYFYENTNTSSAGSSRCLLAGGAWNNGASAGLRYFNVDVALTNSYLNIGASLQKRGV